MHWRFVRNAMRLRARRLSLAFAALGVAAALSTALFSIYGDVSQRVSDQFVSYGANLTVSGAAIPFRALQVAKSAGATAAAPFVYADGMLNGEPVSLVRTDLAAARDLTQFWHVEGKRGECLVGHNVAQRFNLRVASGTSVCQVTGIVSTGGPEDNQLILPLEPGATAANVVEIHAPAGRLDAVEAALEREFPGVRVRQIRAAASTETGVIAKVRVTLFLLLGLILLITTLSVTSNFSELVMERRHEIGILKAIGAREPKIASLFLTESVVLALASAVAGYLAGVCLAGWIGKSVFEAPFAFHMQISALAAAALLTLAVALTATALAARSIWRIEPARILRGE